MSDMWIDLLPVLLAMMISPARTLAVIVLLHTPRSTATAFGYVVGMATAMVVQGAGLAAALNTIGITSDDRSGDLAVFVGAVFLVGGVILLTGAVKIAAAQGDDSLQSALARLESIEPMMAFRIGFGWLFASPKQWVFVLTAVSVIFAYDMAAARSLAVFAVFTLLVQLVYVVIMGGYVAAQERVIPVLDVIFEWTRERLRPIAITVFALFGVVFLWKGIGSLR